jgi:hypothetical protein
MKPVRIALIALPLAAAVWLWLWLAGSGVFGSHEGPGEPTREARPAASVSAEAASVAEAARGIGVPEPKQILFGDLHVHTTISFDAFITSLPSLQGEGSHPQADACDFARFCSALDFWSINDHSEAITPESWRETVDAIRQCNEVAGDPANPDTVAFLGWEWTQVGATPEEHYGHKNVVLAHTDDDRIPARPIAAGGAARAAVDRIPGLWTRALLSVTADDERSQDLVRYFAEREGLADCEDGVDTRELPSDCLERAETPRDLFRKLDEWGHDAIVIPHGTTWGFYTPPGSDWRKQLTAEQHDPDRQTLIEIYSGHGDSEQYRDWRPVELDTDGAAVCPPPTADYLPTCWRAGELIRERCLAEGEDAEECEERAAEARRLAAEALGQAHLTVPGARAADWLDAGQCRDCDEPAFNYRPQGSVQYIMALSNPAGPGAPLRFRFGFMSSSDNHFARPGTGYKERFRRGFTESRGRGGAGGPVAALFAPPEREPAARAEAFDREETELFGFQLFELERQASFFTTGGLVAAHATGRDRDAIWQALARREVYGTSGPRILLWFDLLNPPGSRGETLAMGGAASMADAPIFQARAVGSFEQQPGCPDFSAEALGPDRLAHVCKGECYHPADRRRLVTRIEVVRIRPQREPGEPIRALIEDPWRTFACDPDPAGCAATFSDPDHATDARDALYYVRAYEAPAPAINAANLRCEYDETGACVKVSPCGPDPEDECLAEHEPRAWSSPIFVDHPGATGHAGGSR